MEARKVSRCPWTQETLESLVEHWRKHPSLYDVSHELYHNRVQKEKSWREVAASLKQPVEKVKTRALSLRTQYSRLIKPKPGGSDNKDLTHKQRWLLRAMEFIRPHIVHRPCEIDVDIPLSTPKEELDSSEWTAERSSPSTSPPSPADWTDDGESPGVEEAPSASTDNQTSRQRGPTESAVRGGKRKGRPTETEIELQKLVFLKQMAARVESADQFTTFGNQVAAELRQIHNPSSLTSLKRSIMNQIYDAQDAERQPSSSLPHSTPNFAPMHTPPPHCKPLQSDPEDTI